MNFKLGPKNYIQRKVQEIGVNSVFKIAKQRPPSHRSELANSSDYSQIHSVSRQLHYKIQNVNIFLCMCKEIEGIKSVMEDK
jgi:hypothetical protein